MAKGAGREALRDHREQASGKGFGGAGVKKEPPLWPGGFTLFRHPRAGMNSPRPSGLDTPAAVPKA